jgi:hypothetical protein
VRILDLDELEVLLPIRAFFLQGRWTVADLHPPGRAVIGNPSVVHISQVLAAGDRTFAKRPVFDRC